MLTKSKTFFTTYWDVGLVFVFAIIYAVVFSELSILRHHAFASNYDLANMSQTVWDTLHGHIFSFSGTNGTVNRLAFHADFFLILLAPLYAISAHAKTLLIFQSVALGLGAIPMYLLSRAILQKSTMLRPLTIRTIAVIMAAVYVLNPSLEWTNIYDFHAVAIAIPLLLASFYCAYTRHWLWYALFFVLALLTKEEISLYLAILGLIIAFVFKHKKIGFASFVVGMVWFSTMVFVVIPWVSTAGKHWAFNWYSFGSPHSAGFSLTGTIKDIAKRYTVTDHVLSYYVALLKPFGFLPIIALPWLLLSFPELSINVLSTHGEMRSIMFHYTSGITPTLAIATIFALVYIFWLLKRIHQLQRHTNFIMLLLAAGLLAGALRVNYHYSPLPTTPTCWCIMYQVDDDDRAFEQVLKTIPSNASVTSSSEVRAHLTKRENSFTLPDATDTADYIALVDQNRMYGDYGPKPYETWLISVLLQDKNHTLVSHIGHFYLFKKIDTTSVG